MSREGDLAVESLKTALSMGEQSVHNIKIRGTLKPPPKTYDTDRVLTKHVIVHRGTEGFADRLQVLSNCIEYALLNDAYLCVDWRDPWWQCGFDRYFDLSVVQMISVDQVAEMIDLGASVYPPHTADELLAPLTRENAHTKRFYLGNILLKRDYDIVINSGSTDRGIYGKGIEDLLSFKHSVALELKTVIKQLVVPYICVHLRGSDRSYGKSLDDQLFPVVKHLRKRDGSRRVYVIGDDIALKDRLRETIGILSIDHINYAKYTHDYQVDKLREVYMGSHCKPVDQEIKHRLNIDTLLDFCIMAMAADAYSTCSKSYFFQMSRMLRGTPIYKLFRSLSTNTPETQSER